MLVVGGPAGVLERFVASVCPPSRVSFCFVVVLAELRALLLQRRWLFEGNFAGLGGHAGACACPSKGIAPELRAHQLSNGASAGLTKEDPDFVSVWIYSKSLLARAYRVSLLSARGLHHSKIERCKPSVFD